MEYSEKQYENVAMFLDGQEIELTAAELKLASEISDDQAAISEWIENPGRPNIPNSHQNIWQKRIIPSLAAAAIILMIISVTFHFSTQNSKNGSAEQNNNEMASNFLDSIADIANIEDQQQQIELTTLMIQEHNNSADPVAEDMASNTEQWFEVLDDQQGMAEPVNSFSA